MTVKEYFEQGYRVKHLMEIYKTEIKELPELAYSLSSPGFEESYSASKSIASPFENLIEKVVELQAEKERFMMRLIEYIKERDSIIATLMDQDERLIMHYHYVMERTWVSIGKELFYDEKTIRRKAKNALAHIVLPKNAIQIYEPTLSVEMTCQG